jgi:hypothetical protein
MGVRPKQCSLARRTFLIYSNGAGYDLGLRLWMTGQGKGFHESLVSSSVST